MSSFEEKSEPVVVSVRQPRVYNIQKKLRDATETLVENVEQVIETFVDQVNQQSDSLPTDAASEVPGEDGSNAAGEAATEEVPEDPTIVNICSQYEIKTDYIARLKQLRNFKVVFVLDDSASMSNPINSSVSTRTRWEEAKSDLTTCIDLATTFNPEGCDLYFLNQTPILGITGIDGFISSDQYSSTPYGFTPVTKVLTDIIDQNTVAVQERRLLIIYFTDGYPTDDKGTPKLEEFSSFLRQRRPVKKICVSIVAYTDEPGVISYLNELDKTVKNVDVLETYVNEKAQIQKIQGASFSFSRIDYMTKILLGSSQKWFDNLDEKKVKAVPPPLGQKNSILTKAFNFIFNP